MERMEKDDILRKAQERKGQDEREALVQQRSSALGQSIGLFLCIALIMVKQYADQPRYDVLSLYFIMTSATSLYRWYYLRKRSDLVWGIIGCVLGVSSLVFYLWSVL